jgi:hypothetical protein
LHFSMEHVSFSFIARATEFSTHRRIWFLTEISFLNLFFLVFLSSFFIQCIWTVFQRCASRSAYIVVVVFFLKVREFHNSLDSLVRLLFRKLVCCSSFPSILRMMFDLIFWFGGDRAIWH